MGKTIMISSHILSELEEICDHVGIIEQGRLVFSGTMEEIRLRMGIADKVKVRVAAHPEKGTEVLSAMPQVKEVQPNGENSLLVTLAAGQVNDGCLARALVQGGLDVVGIEPQQVKLDEAFLELTKGLVH
jgi:ABC-2 type transport system ATP-binding protein